MQDTFRHEDSGPKQGPLTKKMDNSDQKRAEDEKIANLDKKWAERRRKKPIIQLNGQDVEFLDHYDFKPVAEEVTAASIKAVRGRLNKLPKINGKKYYQV